MEPIKGMKQGTVKVGWCKLKNPLLNRDDIGLYSGGHEAGAALKKSPVYRGRFRWYARVFGRQLLNSRGNCKSFPSRQAAKEAVELAVNMHDNG